MLNLKTFYISTNYENKFDIIILYKNITNYNKGVNIVNNLNFLYLYISIVKIKQKEIK